MSNNYIKLRNIGNYTKGAVKQFENNIVSEKDYLEKVSSTDSVKDENK